MEVKVYETIAHNIGLSNKICLAN